MKIQTILVIGKNASGDVEEEALELITYNWFERALNWFGSSIFGNGTGVISVASVSVVERKLWSGDTRPKGRSHTFLVCDDLEHEDTYKFKDEEEHENYHNRF